MKNLFDFKVFEGVTLEDLGTLASIVGKGGKLRFAGAKNLNSDKRVSVVMLKADGTSDTVSCSGPVSIGVRKALESGTAKNKVLAALAKLSVLAGDSEIPFICAPLGAGGAEEEFTVEQLSALKNADYESVIAF